MLTRFCLYGFLKNQRYFEPFFMLALLAQGLSFFWIGVLYATRSLTLNLMEIPSGVLADGWGRRRCMIVSFFAYVLSFTIFAFADNWLWFFPAMVLFGLGDSFRTGTHKAMIFEWLRLQGRENERTRVYGVTRSWSKFGSAISAILAAVFVLWTGDYQKIFLFATIPYLMNIVNFLGYPKELDGLHHQEDGAVPLNLNTFWRRTIQTVRSIWQKPSLRHLTAESMAWEGILHSVKDYLQPALIAVVIAVTLDQTRPSSEPVAETVSGSATDPAVVILIGATYTVLFLLSGWASRSSHRVVKSAGSEERAAVRLWRANLVLYLLLGLFDLVGWMVLVALMFVALMVLHNLWRPILISRIDQHADPGRGATVLSIESQAQRFTSMIVAPIVGLAIDRVAAGSIGHLYPVAIAGCLAAAWMLLTAKKPALSAE
ncbi:MAG: MFS transporter [Pirellulaceae bacterium]